MNRRDLIRSATLLGATTVAGRVWAAPRAEARLLVVFLRGAYDAANVLVPTGSDFYYRARPNLALARPDPANAAAALPLDADWSLNPALRETILPLFAKGQAAFVPFAGTDDVTRSHFETQDTIELGQTAGAARDYNSGFMGRLAAELTRVRPIAFTEQVPLVFRGAETVPNIAINGVGKPGIDARQAKLIAAMYRDSSLRPAVEEGFRVREAVYQSISDHAAQADRGAVSPKGFELSARRIGRLMRDGFNLGFVDVGGWDTHVNRGRPRATSPTAWPSSAGGSRASPRRSAPAVTTRWWCPRNSAAPSARTATAAPTTATARPTESLAAGSKAAASPARRCACARLDGLDQAGRPVFPDVAPADLGLL